MEYKEFAKYYDKFYQKKDYNNEVNFLMNFIKDNDSIIDIGCGTGVHMALISKKGFKIEGLDSSNQMLDIAKTKVKTNFYLQSILDINIDKKYDIVISMFAVINHLKNTDELKLSLINMKKILNENGKIILDLHNPQKSGKKVDKIDDIERTMEWDYNRKTHIETSQITFKVDNNKYQDSHVFRIFSIEEIKNCCKDVGLKVVGIYENYNINVKGQPASKNLQFIITME